MKQLLAKSLIVVSFICIPSWTQLQADTGYSSLCARLGSATPTGAGIPVSQIEGLYYGYYLPDANHVYLAGKTFTIMSGASGVSDHATNVGVRWYGATAMALDVTDIHVYEADDFLNSGFLYCLSSREPLPENQRVQNHSYIFDTGSSSTNTDLLRRLDMFIDRDGVVTVVGTNNGVTSMPVGWSSAYNVITVGLTNGLSSVGPTSLDTSGRVKPDVVAPSTVTSFATCYTSAAATLLLETIEGMPALNGFSRTWEQLLTKALLMGGATKDEFTDWRQGFSREDRKDVVPLDYRYGAGEINIDHSHRILTSGQQAPGDVLPTGWDVDKATSGVSRTYFFDIPSGSTATTLSILATWNRKIVFTSAPDFNLNGGVDYSDVQYYLGCATGVGIAPSTECTDADLDDDNDVDLADFSLMQRCMGEPTTARAAICEGFSGMATLTPVLANIDLKLHQATGTTIGAEIDKSISSLDNVEHIFQQNVAAGRYAIVLTTDQDADFALTWDAILSTP